MTQLYRRNCQILVGDPAGANALDFAQFKCAFNVVRGDSQTPNSCDLRVYNLNDQTQSQVANEFTQMAIQVSYGDNTPALIFTGTIKQVRKGRDNGKDSYLDITAADGDRAYNFAPIMTSVRAGSKSDEIADALIQAFGTRGVTKGYVPQLSASASVRGQVLFGMARDVARGFAADQDCLWSIQDGKFVMIPLSGYLPGTVPVISATGGLIGAPEQTQNGIRMRTLMNPLYRIGSLVKLDAQVNLSRLPVGLGKATTHATLNAQLATKTDPSGLYYVMSANHTGDTRGRPWYTDLICLAACAQITPQTKGLIEGFTPDPIPAIAAGA